MQRSAGTLMRAVFLSFGFALLAVPVTAAEVYPSHPVKWIVPYPPAGTTDILARVVGAALSGPLMPGGRGRWPG